MAPDGNRQNTDFGRFGYHPKGSEANDIVLNIHFLSNGTLLLHSQNNTHPDVRNRSKPNESGYCLLSRSAAQKKHRNEFDKITTLELSTKSQNYNIQGNGSIRKNNKIKQYFLNIFIINSTIFIFFITLFFGIFFDDFGTLHFYIFFEIQ